MTMKMNDLRKNLSKHSSKGASGMDKARSNMNSLRAIKILESMRGELGNVVSASDLADPIKRMRAMQASQMAMDYMLRDIEDKDEAQAVRKQMGSIMLSAAVHTSVMKTLEAEGKWNEGELEQVGEMVVGMSLQLAQQTADSIEEVLREAVDNPSDPLYEASQLMLVKEENDPEADELFANLRTGELSKFNKWRTMLTTATMDRAVALCIDCAHMALDAAARLNEVLDEEMGAKGVRTMLEGVAMQMDSDK